MSPGRQHLQAMAKQYRTKGYDDGYAGRPAASTNATYQAAWRRGREAREAEKDTT